MEGKCAGKKERSEEIGGQKISETSTKKCENEKEGRADAGAVPLAAGIDHRWLARQRVLLCTAEERKKGRTKGEVQ